MFRFAVFLSAGLMVPVLAGPGAAQAAEIQCHGQAAFEINTSGGKVIVRQRGDKLDFWSPWTAG